MAKRPLKGSERAPLPGAQAVGPADPSERLQVSVIVRPTHREALNQRVTRLAQGDHSVGALRREEFAKEHGASAADLNAIREFAKAHGLTVAHEHAGRRTVVLSGTVSQFNNAFGTQLRRYQHPGGTYRGREGAIQIPEGLSDIVEAVLGLDDRPQAKPHFQRRRAADANKRAAAAVTSFNPTQLATLYGFPDSQGAGQCVGIIELGGGYNTSDLQTYFSGLGVSEPTVTAVSVDQGTNSPTGDPDGADGEVMLDIEVVGSIAPGATLAVYFAPNTDAGFLDAITTAMHDTTHKPSIISISWGGPESSWTQQAMTSMDQALQDAATMGITVCVASGDSGSTDGVSGGGNHVDFPASSPYALACGGTSLKASSTAITSEVVWNDGNPSEGAGGGGVSTFFAVPSWQEGLKATPSKGRATALSHRGVPDVAGDADPNTGYNVRVDGTDTVIGGTSAVAPLWAGLLARVNAINGQAVGYLNPKLYADPSALRDITQGNNGGFEATTGWDACTGLGSPHGAKIASL